MSKLGARIRTGGLLALCAGALLWLHQFFPAGGLSLAVMFVLVSFAVWELDRMGSLRGRRLGILLHLGSLVSAAGLAILLVRDEVPAAPLGLLLLYALAFLCSWPWVRWPWAVPGMRVEDGRTRLPVVREVLPAALWLLPPLYGVVLIDHAYGTRGLVALVVLAKVGDNAGYFVGRAIGKRHPFPNVSPGKTVAGCVASLLAGVATGAALLPFALGTASGVPQVALGGLIGGLVNLGAQAGDLSESWVKRRAGVKDSSTLLGPSGGVLDVVDSLLLATPVALVLWSWAYARADG